MVLNKKHGKQSSQCLTSSNIHHYCLDTSPNRMCMHSVCTFFTACKH